MENNKPSPTEIHLPEISELTVHVNNAGGITIAGDLNRYPDQWVTVDSKDRLRELINALRTVGRSCAWKPEEGGATK